MYEVPASAKAAVDSIINEATQHLQFLLGDHVKAKLVVIEKQGNVALFKELICLEFSVKWNMVQSKSRETELVEARQAFAYLCHLYTEMRDAEIMQHVNRDRTNFYPSLTAAESKLFTKDPYFYPKVQSIINQLNFKNAPETN